MINFKKVVSVIVLFSFVLTSCSNNNGWGGSSKPDPTRIDRDVVVVNRQFR
ncbi:MAG: hypothetical protein LE168_00325 [Endomicrobium sp.]|nr:hypothetical protein [Endomicrobium sp.]